MSKQKVNTGGSRAISWVDFLALGCAFFGTIVSLYASIGTYIGQGQVSSEPLWPLPGLVLTDWAVLGVAGFIAAYFCMRQSKTKWLYAAWIVAGALIPLIFLGAFSIGPIVLIGFFFYILSVIIYTIRQKEKFLPRFGLFLVGSICNLGILLLFIAIGRG